MGRCAVFSRRLSERCPLRRRFRSIIRRSVVAWIASYGVDLKRSWVEGQSQTVTAPWSHLRPKPVCAYRPKQRSRIHLLHKADQLVNEPTTTSVNRRPWSLRLLQKGWLALVTVAALAVGSLGVWKAHQMSEPGPVPTVLTAQAPEQFTPKELTYELFGTLDSSGLLSYVDINGHPHSVDITELPWSHTETTTLTVVSGSISAQVDGGFVGCRMLVNGIVRDEQTATRNDADVTCRVKSA